MNAWEKYKQDRKKRKQEENESFSGSSAWETYKAGRKAEAEQPASAPVRKTMLAAEKDGFQREALADTDTPEVRRFSGARSPYASGFGAAKSDEEVLEGLRDDLNDAFWAKNAAFFTGRDFAGKKEDYEALKAQVAELTAKAKAQEPASEDGGFMSEYFKDMKFLPDSWEGLGRGLAYNAERAAAGALGFGEGITDFLGTALYKGVEGLTSGFGLAPNAVSRWAGQAAEDFLKNSVTDRYNESIRLRYNPSEGEEAWGGLTQGTADVLTSLATGKAVAKAVSGGAQLLDDAANAAREANIVKGGFGLSAAGRGAKEAYDEGATTGEALIYGGASGMAEVLIESLAGGIPGMGEGKLSQIVKKVVDNPVVNGLLDVLGEGGEEALSAVISPFLKRAVYDPDAEMASIEEIGESAVIGALTSLGLQGLSVPGTVNNVVSRAKADAEYRRQVSDAIRNAAVNVEQEQTTEKTTVQPAESARLSNSQVERMIRDEATMQEMGIDTNGKTMSQLRAEVRARMAAQEQGAVERSEGSRIQTPAQETALRNDSVAVEETSEGIMNPITPQTRAEYNEITRTEGMTNGEEVHLRNGSQRDGSAYPGGQVSAVAESAGRAESGQAAGRPADSGAASLSYGEKVSTASLGIGNGLDKPTVRILKGGDTQFTVEAKRLAKQHELRVVLFAGDNLSIRQKDGQMASVRGYITGDRVFIRADHPLYTADQIMRHEVGHDMIAKGEINPETVRERISQIHGKEKVAQYSRMYAEAYEGTGLTPDEIWEEVICDSLGDMNIFADASHEGIAGEFPHEGKQVGQAETVENLQKRGPPADGKASREAERTALANRLTYEKLVAKPDMMVTTIDDTIRYQPNSQTRKQIVSDAIKNAASIGKTNDSGGVTVHVDDLGSDVLLSTHGLKHGLDRRLQDNAPVTLKAGEILKNSILVNELIPKADNISESFVLLGAAKNEAGAPYIVEFVVNRYDNSVESIDVLYSANAKKESAVRNAPAITGDPLRITDSVISIAQLMDFATANFPDVLPESVLRHYGYASRPEGSLGESALYSRELEGDSDPTNEELQIQTELQNEIRAEVRAQLERMGKEYGWIPSGENPSRAVQIPKRTAPGNKVSQTVRTILEAQATPDEMVPNIEKLVAEGKLSYTPYGDEAAVQDANAYITKVGWDQAQRAWFSDMRTGVVSKRNTTMGWVLYDNAANEGNTKLALDILNEMVKGQRNAAQALQATRILKTLSPETQLYGVQQSVESLTEDLKKRYGDNVPDLTIDPAMAEKFLNAGTDKGRAEAMQEIYRDIGRQMPSRFMDKFNAWRYLAMLGNPRTHVRNIIGNAGFAPVVAVKNLTAAGIERLVLRNAADRTKAVALATKEGRALLKAAWTDYANVVEAMPDGKYSDLKNANKYIEEGRVIFGKGEGKTVFGRVLSNTAGKLTEKARRFNSGALAHEDMWFAKPHYASALAQYCKAHGITVEELQRGKTKRVEVARNYAMREAQKATYQDANEFSEFFSRLGRNPSNKKTAKAMNALVEGVLPFRKTPANILVRSVEYSPLGLVRGLKNVIWGDVRKGKVAASEAIDRISSGLTGTALLGLGVWLAAEGLVRGHGDDEKDKEKDFTELQGHQGYALELPDGTSITLDWLAPEALPFFIGVNLWEMTNGMEEAPKMEDLLGAVSNVSEPLLEMSCLQGLNDLLDSVGYASSEGLASLPQVLISAATSLLTQMVPTLLGQIERTGETVRMTTYTDKNKFLDSDTQYFLGRVTSRIPGLDYGQIPYIDAWGREEATGGPFERAFNNFLNPAYMSEVNVSEMEAELERLYEATGEVSVLPSRAAKDFTVDEERKDLTGKEYVEYATYRGQRAYELLTELTGGKLYQKLSNAEKQKVVEKCYEVANEEAKSMVSDFELGKFHEQMAGAQKKGISNADYIVFYKTVSAMETIKDAKGKEVKNVATQVRDWLKNSSFTRAQKEYLWSTRYSSAY